MIVIVDDDKTKRSTDIKNCLDEYLIPSVVCDIDHISNYPEALAVFTLVNSEIRLSKVSLRCKKIPVLAVNESGSRLYNDDVIFFDPMIHGSYTDFIIKFIGDRYGIVPSDLRFGGLYFTGGILRYGFAAIKLTPTEKRILVLLMMCKDSYVSEFSIAHTCFKRTGNGTSSKVSVHVCNINKKFCEMTGRNLILTRRGSGYMLDSAL